MAAMTPLDLTENPQIRHQQTRHHDNAASASVTKLGRPMDVSRDADILEAALDVLAEEGYDGMTIDMVAARARAGKATLYRRWPSKTELVLDAVACMKSNDIDLADLPDTGTLRGDLLAQIKPPSIKDGERKMRVMAGLISLLARNPDLVEAANRAIIAPRAEVNRVLIQRAIDRGEVAADVDIELVSLITPSIISYRMMMLRKPIDRDFLVSLLDTVVLPALGLGATAASRP
jgi:AcrR family transcriptional regulator